MEHSYISYFLFEIFCIYVMILPFNNNWVRESTHTFFNRRKTFFWAKNCSTICTTNAPIFYEWNLNVEAGGRSWKNLRNGKGILVILGSFQMYFDAAKFIPFVVGKLKQFYFSYCSHKRPGDGYEWLTK